METEGGDESKQDDSLENNEAAMPSEAPQAEEEEEEEEDNEDDALLEKELLEKELLEREEVDGEEGDDEEDGGEASGTVEGEEGQKKRHRRNIRRMINDDDLAEETRLEQERERERIQWLKDLHEKSVAEEKAKREKRRQLAEERKKQKTASGESNQVILLDDSDGESEEETMTKKPPTVITLSSDESEEEDSPLTGYDDTTGFVGGMHTDDTKNVCDKDGRVLVNVNHPPDEADIFLTDLLARTVKNHQIGGIRFLYDNIIESLSRFSYSNGFGCILAHTMGLGKTVQSISFVDCCLRNTPCNTVLIVVPVNVVQNWVNEFNMWVPGPESTRDIDEKSRRIYPVFVINDMQKTFDARATIIKKWHENGGVLILGYEMFRLLALTEPSYAVSKKLCKRRRKRGNIKEVVDLDEEEFYMDLLKATQAALLNPGPDIVVCDEGHRIKNAHATISKALKKIKTRRRIVLTGYPLQNNLEEYWCMIDFVRPNFLGTKNEFNNMFVRPIENGQCVDSTPKDTQLMKFRSHVLHSLLEGFVQRRDQSILQRTLQSKTEYVLCVKMSPLQKQLIKRFTTEMEYEGGVNPIYAFTVLTKIWNHPDVLQEVVSSSKLDDLDVDLPKASTKMSLEWAKEELVDVPRGVLEDGTKMLLLINLIEEGVSLGDKVVVFSQSLLTLSLVERFLHQRVVPPHPGLTTSGKKDIRGFYKQPANGEGSPEYHPSESSVKWTKNKHYFRLDGSTNAQDREKLINNFNKKIESALVFLISTRAGSLGVNLIGSNRVIIMDVSWNPCHDAQAVCRIYRYGQTKPSYVYRFVAESTLERTIYNKQVTKQGLSSRVIDEANPEKQFSSSEIVSSADNLDFHPEEELKYNWQEAATKITDPVLKTVMERYGSLLTSAPFTHESLLIENKEERLTVAEKVMAKKSYQYEKQMNKNFGNYTSNYSKPVNRVSPMCNNQLLTAKQNQLLSAKQAYSTPPREHITSSQWEAQKTSPLANDLPEKFNMMQSWTNMIKPLSPIAPTPEEQRPQQQTFVFTNNRTPPTFSNSSKHRSILPAPSTGSQQQQPYIIRPLGGQQQSKLPLPRVAPVAQSIYPAHESKKTPVPIRSKKTSKVVPNIRPVPQGQNGIMQDAQYLAPLNDSEHMIQSHDNQPEPADTGQISIAPQPPPILPASLPPKVGKPKVKTGDIVKPGSITDALRKIDERIVEPPTVVAQRMIEQNRNLRRQAELHDIEEHSMMKSHHEQMPSMGLEMVTIVEPEQLADVGAEIISESKVEAAEPDTAKVEDKEAPEAEPSEQPPVIAPGQQMVYQAHPITASNMSNGYQLLIQVPGNMGGQPQLIQGQQILQGQQFGNRPVFIQKQPSPVIQMAQAGAGAQGKTIYLMSQPSPIQPVGAPQGQYTTSPMLNNYAYLAPQDGIIRLNRPSNEGSEVKTEEERSIPPQGLQEPQRSIPPQGLQQTPAPTSLQQITYEEQAKNQYNVQMQQYQYQQQFQQQRAQMDPQLAMQQYYQMNNAAQAKPKPKAKARAPPKPKTKPKPKETEDQQQQRMFLPQQQQLQQQQRQFAFQQQYNQRMMGQVPQYQYSNRIDPSQQHPQHPSQHPIQPHPSQQHLSQQNPTQPQLPPQQHPQQLNQQLAQQMPSENSPQMPHLSQQIPQQQQRMPQQMVQQHRPQLMNPGQQPNRAQLMQQMQANIKANSARNVQRKMSEEDARSPHPASPHPASPHPGTPHGPGTTQSHPGTPQSHPGTPQSHPGIPAQYNNQGMYSTFSYGPQSAQQLKQQQAKTEEVKPPQFSVQQAKQKLQGSDQPSAQFGRFDASPFTAASPPEKPKKKPAPKKKDEKKAPAKKRAPKRKADQATPDPRSLHIHAPITFPLEKRTKKVAQRKPSSEKSPLCPYDQQVQSPVYNNTQQTTNMSQQQTTNMSQQQTTNMSQQQTTNMSQQQTTNMSQQQTTNMYPNMPTLHQYGQDMKPQQFLPPNQQPQQRMQQYQQWGGEYQQQNMYASQQSPYNPLYQQQFTQQQQFQQQRSYSPPSTEDIDVNQFLNIPIKNKEGEQS